MKMNRRTEITMETHELTIIRFSRSQKRFFCETCAAHVSPLKVGQAALALSLSETAIFRLSESGQIHSAETTAGSLLLCGKSLAALAEELTISDKE